ncbi:hypothetical protein Tco_1526126 [Tanacetum coccineum]
MADSSSSMPVARLAVDELVEFTRTCIGHLYIKISEMEAMPNRLEVYDSLLCLKESKEAENNKLARLNDVIAQIEEVIRMKEGHAKVMEEAIRFG